MSMIGQSVGPYRLEKCVGQGNYGEVFEAVHEETGEHVAVKFLYSVKQFEPEVQSRFVREISVLERLDHENVVRFLDAGLYADSIYCVMELVTCGTLNDVLNKRGRLPWREAAEVTAQVCRALDHAHERGVVHRDLKPANLYLSEDGFVKLGDLGLARDLTNTRLTITGQTVGTRRYMAPEQIQGNADIDGRLDIYAMGCILYQMISGRVPFDGTNPVEVFEKHLYSEAPRLDAIAPDCPKELADLTHQMLGKAPDDRPQSAAVVAAALAEMLAGDFDGPQLMQAVSRQATDGETTDEPAPEPNLTQRLLSGAPEQGKEVNWKALAIAGAVIVVVALVVALNR